MANISFYCQGQTLEITSNITYPSSPVPSTTQVVERTHSGKPVVEDSGNYEKSTIVLTFSKLKNDEYDLLEDFVRNVSHWAVYPIVYTDPDAVEWTVIVTSRELNFPRSGAYYRTGSITLETVPS